VCLFFNFEDPPFAHSGPSDSHSSRISFRGAGQSQGIFRKGKAGGRKLLKAKIAVALQDELGRVPKQEEIKQVNLLARVMYKAILGLHYKRKEQKKNGQLAIF
jgi:hypothetical protein